MKKACLPGYKYPVTIQEGAFFSQNEAYLNSNK